MKGGRQVTRIAGRHQRPSISFQVLIMLCLSQHTVRWLLRNDRRQFLAALVGLGHQLLERRGEVNEKTTSVRFTDVTAAAGLTFQHFNAASPHKYILETMGSGCAWIDYDGDGFLD